MPEEFKPEYHCDVCGKLFTEDEYNAAHDLDFDTYGYYGLCHEECCPLCKTHGKYTL